MSPCCVPQCPQCVPHRAWLQGGLREYLVSECVLECMVPIIPAKAVLLGEYHMGMEGGSGRGPYLPGEAPAQMQNPAAPSAYVRAGCSSGPRRAGWPCLPLHPLTLPILASVPTRAALSLGYGWVFEGLSGGLSVLAPLGTRTPQLPSKGALEPETLKCPARGLVRQGHLSASTSG